jgi:hypothetical protein
MIAVILGLSGPAVADEDLEELIVEEPKKGLSSDIVTRLDNLPETEPNWLRTNIHTVRKYGFEFTRSYTMKDRDRKIVLGVRGPLISKKAAGLTFEIRF